MTHARRLLTIALLAVLTACADPTVTDPSFGKGGSRGDPTVTGTSPTDAPQDTTLDIRVFGSNFDRNARADLALDSVVGPKVRTNSTRYVSSSELVANVTIAVDADTGAYDVVVTLSTGKKGIGTEMFQVRRNGPKPPPPPPPTLEALAPIDLDEGMVRTHYGYGINDNGWAFVLSVAGDGSWHGLVWLTLTPHDSTVLPGAVTQPRGGNGRGDYITYWAKVMLRGPDGWTLGPRLYAPAGWPDTAKGISTGVQMIAINDARLVVGYAKDPNRSLYSSPVAWIYDEATGNWTPFAMSVPASSNPTSCEVTGVYPQAVNDAGMVVGYAFEKALSRKAVCPDRAIVWETVFSEAKELPTTGIPGHHQAAALNERGDITGETFNSSGSSATTGWRPVRWHWQGGTWTIEVLNDYEAQGEAIDQCGRVVILTGAPYESYLWETDGSVVRRFAAPPGFGLVQVFDVRGTLAVGRASNSTLGYHALVWTLPACTP